MKTGIKTFTTASDTEFFGVGDYTDVAIRLVGIWDGSIEFYGTNGVTFPSSTSDMSPLAVQDIASTNWTTAAVSEAGSSPSTELKVFRVPVAGLTQIAVKTASGYTGTVLCTITAVSNTNAR